MARRYMVQEKPMSWLGRRIGGALGGLSNLLGGVGEVVSGIVTLDFDRAGSGFGQLLGGALDAVTFGGFSNLVDHMRGLFRVPESPERDFQSRKQMATRSDTPKRIIYGESLEGGQLVLWESTGTDSQFLWMIIALAPHVVESIGDIYFNDVVAVPGGSSTGQDEFGGLVTAYRFDGTQTAADATLVAEIPSWTSDHIGEGIAYIALRVEYDRDAFSRGIPEVSAVVKGKKVFDPRTETTAWSDNHALCVLDYLRSDLGFRCDDDEIDFPSFETGANVCEEQFAAADGTEDRYTINGSVSTQGSPLDNLDSLLRGGAAMTPYLQGVFTYVAGRYTTPVADFDETDIVGDLSFTTGPSKRTATNVVKGLYIDARQNYEPVSYPRFSVAAYIERDGEELETELNAPFANSPTLARRLAKIAVETERFGVSASVTMKFTASEISVGDRIRLSVDRLGWENKIFRVISSSISMGQGVNLGLREDAPEVWDWDSSEALDVTPPPAVNIPNREPIPAPGLTLSERVNTPNTQNQDRTTILMQSTPPEDARYNHTEFSYRLAGTDQWYPIGYSSDNSASIVVQAAGATYEVRARPVSSVGRVWNTEAIESITVYNRKLDGLPDPARGALPAIYGLRILNQVPGTLTQFKSGNAELAWQPQSQTEFREFSDDAQGVDSGQLDPYFDDYRVRFFSSGQLRFEDYTRQPRYTLSLEDNRRYGIGRAFRVEVVARGANGQIGKAEEIGVENPAPAAPVVSLESGFTSLRATFARPDDLDFVGFDFYVVTGDGDPYAATPERLSGNTVTLDGLSPGTQHTIGVVSVDQFGTGGAATPVTVTLPMIPAADVDGLGAWATQDVVSAAFVSEFIESGSIISGLLAANAVIAEKIADGAVDSDKLAAAAVTNAKLADLAVDAAKLADGSVDLTGNKITGQLAGVNLADAAVDTDKLADLSVAAAKLADGSVTTTKIANLAVGTAAIASAAITSAKIANLAVDTAQIADAAIEAAKIANLAVGTAAIQNLAVTDAKIAEMAVGKLLAGAIAVQVDVGESANRVLIDGESGLIQTVNAGYTMTYGAHDVPGESSDPLILSANDGFVYPFWVDATGSARFGDLLLSNDGSIAGTEFAIDDEGNATFSGTLSAAGGVFGDTEGQFISFDGTNLEIETPEFSVDDEGNATFGGVLSAAGGTFTGTLDGVNGNFTGSIVADSFATNTTNPRIILTSFPDPSNPGSTSRTTLAVTIPNGAPVGSFGYNDNTGKVAASAEDLRTNRIYATDGAIFMDSELKYTYSPNIEISAAGSIDINAAFDLDVEANTISISTFGSFGPRSIDISAIGSVLLSSSAGTVQANGSQVATFYSGDSASETNLPRGSIVVVSVEDTNVARNASATVRLSTANNRTYTLDGSGSALSGTWRCRGEIPNAVADVQAYLFQRTA
jgi:hypothetical protein